ncbi:MAG: hypothetical protein KDI13_06240 [Alphaproteobacteria bacterium]|nr:hypothetical protein [Alphaproteobacteria bacterium]
MKNILILVLLVVCAALAYMQFGPKPAAPLPPPPDGGERISAGETIDHAEIEGVSLSTLIEQVDDLVEAAGYICRKGDHEVRKAEDRRHQVKWNCDREEPKSAIHITAKDGQIVTIERSGAIYPNMVSQTIDYLDVVKSHVNTRDMLVFNQKPGQVLFALKDGEDNQTHRLYYYLVVGARKNADGAIVDTASLRVMLSR